ncbi:hypothetical protein SDJN02_17076, partial [Cucurbita argyrosperma subsp. argyrosperma]
MVDQTSGWDDLKHKYHDVAGYVHQRLERIGGEFPSKEERMPAVMFSGGGRRRTTAAGGFSSRSDSHFNAAGAVAVAVSEAGHSQRTYEIGCDVRFVVRARVAIETPIPVHVC